MRTKEIAYSRIGEFHDTCCLRNEIRVPAQCLLDAAIIDELLLK